jgi:nitrogen fixation NifU-like protein
MEINNSRTLKWVAVPFSLSPEKDKAGRLKMADTFDAFVENLQEKIFDETRQAFGDAGFERWQNPIYRGPLADANSHARVKGDCGDTMQIFLKFEGGRVSEAAYLTDGCGSSTVCGSFAAEMAHGKTPDELTEITGDAILEKLGRFPEEDRHCAFLAAAALQEALNRYMIDRQRER